MQSDNGAKRFTSHSLGRPQLDPLTKRLGAGPELSSHRIAIIGASGKLGNVLVPALQDAGAEVVLFGRDVHRLHQRFPGIESAASEQFAQALRNRPFSAVLDLATLNNRVQASLADFREVNVARTAAVAAEAHAAGIPLFVSFSTTHAIDPNNDHPYAISKREARERLLSGDYPAVRLLILPKVVTAKAGSPRAGFCALFGALKPIVLSSDVVDAVIRLISIGSASPRETYVRPTGEKIYLFLSRVMDVLVAITILLGAAWIMLILGLWVKIDSEGPAIFAQRRVGRHEKLFTLYKFRTMAVGTQEAGTHQLTASSVTRVGAVLRRLKLDELPQMLNILRGELSLVGPRPCLPIQDELIEMRRLAGIFALRPGLTGLAQTNGVDMSDPPKLVAWEIRYCNLRRLLLDLNILVHTLMGRGGGDRTSV